MNTEVIRNANNEAFAKLFGKQSYADDPVRAGHLARFLATGLPGKKDEDYKFTPFDRIIDTDMEDADLTVSPLEKKQVEPFFNQISGHHLVFVDGYFVKELSSLQKDEALTIHTEDQPGHLNSIADPDDPFTALNSAFVGSYPRITVKGHREALPLFIYHFVNATSASFTNPRLCLTAEEGAKIALVEKTWVEGEAIAFINQVVELSVGRNASVNYSKLQNHSRNVIIHDGMKVKQARDSRFYSNTYSFSGKQIRNNLDVQLAEANGETHMHGLYLLDGTSHVDNHTTVDHMVANCYSNEVYKGIADGKSHAVFNGKIFVRPNAQQTNAFQSNNNISLSDLATIHTKPQLEIWADDVKCSHGCTIGQLDSEALFYLRARGLDRQTARSLLLIAFAEDSFENIPFDFLKMEIDQIIQSRLG